MGSERIARFYFGGLIIAALVLGGGTAKGNWPAFVVQLMVLPLAFAIPRDRLAVDRWPALLLGAVFLTFLLQLLPIGLAPRYADGLDITLSNAITLDLGRTLDCLAFVATCGIVFLFVASRSAFEQSRLVGFFFIGVLLNLAVALVQFAATRGVTVAAFLPYELGAGFFANQNHFSSLLYMAIPLVVWQCVAVRRPWIALPVVAFIVFVQFAAGSLAGIFVSIGATLLSFALLTRGGFVIKALLVGLALIGAMVLASNPGNVLEVNVESPIDRPMLLVRTLQGALANLPWGTGFGTFTLAYPQLEQTTDIFSVVVNHAHNDFAEILLEAGIPGALLLTGYLVLLALRIPTLAGSTFRTALLLALVFVLIHSMVDYPLRTMGLAIVFAGFNGILFARREETRATARRASPETASGSQSRQIARQ